jgi:predicted GH43/DUF377 family glycosyl hydrolase
MQLKRFDGNPILSPDPASSWQSLITTNPGAWYDPQKKEVQLLFRAAGNDPEHKIHLGLATSKDGYHFSRVGTEPVLSPSVLGFDGGCVEDPRVIKIGEWYYVTYASRPLPPGQYWLANGAVFKIPECPPEFPWHLRENATTTYLGLTKDFKTWYRAGRLTRPEVDDRDVYFFPEKIAGKFWMIHRPMNWTGPKYGTEYPAMWISSGDDLLACRDAKLLAKAEFDWEKKIGGNTPPIKTPIGWLTLYHAVGSDKKYRLGALLLDLHDPTKVTHRTRDWILQPEKDYELQGFYPGVCFPCGKVVIGDTLFVYYGGADKYVGLATCKLEELLGYLMQCPV